VIVKFGDSLTLIGREGSGPGEFGMIADLGWRGDTVWTSDLRLQRVQMFSAEGTLIRSVSPPARATFAWVGGDTLVGFPLQSIAESVLTIVRFVPGHSELDTLAVLRHPLVAPLKIEAQGNTLMGPQPLAERATGARSPDGSRWCGAEPGREASVRLACIAPDGRVLLDTTVTIHPEPLGENEVAEVLDGFAEIPGFPREKVAAALYVPGHRARVSRMLLEDDGAIWLQRTSSRDSIAVWERWSADGVREATLSLASHQRALLFHRGTLYVAAADEDDLQRVERCHLD
jgi:hypothetical protein